MGLGFVLIFWAAVGITFSVIGGACFSALAAWYTRSVPQLRKRVMLVAGLVPFACFTWMGGVFVFQAVVNEVWLDRDPGLGDGWHAPLPNGYRIDMIDIPTFGYIRKSGSELNGMLAPAVADDVIQLQVEVNRIFGAIDTKAFDHSGEENYKADLYFVLDTVQGGLTKFEDVAEFQKAVRSAGYEPKLEPTFDVYYRYRFTWFDWAVLPLFIVPPICGAGALVLWIARVRRSAVEQIS